jgi:hypothetical protein
VLQGVGAADDKVTGYVFDSSEALVESVLGRQLIPGEEYALVTAARRWLTQNDCPREPHARGRGRYLVPSTLREGSRRSAGRKSSIARY